MRRASLINVLLFQCIQAPELQSSVRTDGNVGRGGLSAVTISYRYC
jgi:hypothetical protein